MATSKATCEAVRAINKALTGLRWEHDEKCLCWYRQLRAEGKPIISEIAALLDAEEAAA
jgi:hypothetical protein